MGRMDKFLVYLIIFSIFISFSSGVLAEEIKEKYYTSDPGKAKLNIVREIEDHLYRLTTFVQCKAIKADHNGEETLSPRVFMASSRLEGTAFVIGDYLVALKHTTVPDLVAFKKEYSALNQSNEEKAGCWQPVSKDYYVIDINNSDIFYKVEKKWELDERDLIFFSLPQEKNFMEPLPVKIGDPKKLEAGDFLAVVGFPKLIPRALMREGRVANDISLSSGTFGLGNEYIYFMSSLNVIPGDSGSPVFAFKQDGTPELVGIVWGYLADAGVGSLILRIDWVMWQMDAIGDMKTKP